MPKVVLFSTVFRCREIRPVNTVALLDTMCAHWLGKGAQRIGTVEQDDCGFVRMKTRPGGFRVVDALVGEPLPRIF